MSRQQAQQYINQGVRNMWSRGEDVTTSICGTTNVCVLRFDTTTQGPGAGVDGLVVATTAAAGTSITITRAGMYYCSLTYPATAGGTINHIGITVNTDAAGLINDPGMATTGIGDYASTLSPAGMNHATKLVFVATITRALAVAGAVIRFHAGDGANATPAAGDLTEAEVQYEVVMLQNII